MADQPKEENKAKVVTPNSAPPAPGEKQIVDNSAPADDNIKEIKSGDRKDEVPAVQNTVQPGDPSVKENKGGVITERDPKPGELKEVDSRKKPEHVTEADQAKKLDDSGNDGDTPDETAVQTDNGQQTDPANLTDVDEDERTAALRPAADEDLKYVDVVNPTGQTVEVLESDIIKRHMLAAGFKLKSSETYSDEIHAEEEAYNGRIRATAGLNAGVDQGDPLQSSNKADVDRRKGSKPAPTKDGKPQPTLATAINADKPTTFDGVDKRENGQIADPQTGKPKRNARLAQALQQ